MLLTFLFSYLTFYECLIKKKTNLKLKKYLQKITKKQSQQQQRRKSSNNSNVNVSDDLQLAISKMLPNVVDLKPPTQVRLITLYTATENIKKICKYITNIS